MLFYQEKDGLKVDVFQNWRHVSVVSGFEDDAGPRFSYSSSQERNSEQPRHSKR